MPVRSVDSSKLCGCPCRKKEEGLDPGHTRTVTRPPIHGPLESENRQLLRYYYSKPKTLELTLSGACEFRRSQTRIKGSDSRGVEVISFVGC